MIAYDTIEILKLYSLLAQKPCMLITFDTDQNIDEILKAAPYLNIAMNCQIISDGIGFLQFNSTNEMEKYFQLTVGDDGPTKTNPYNGPARVYAITCNNGQLENENT